MSSEGLDDRKRVNRIPAWLRWSLRGLAILALVAHQVLINKGIISGTEDIRIATAVAAAIVVGAAATFPLQVGVAFATLLGAAYGAVILLASDATDAPTAPACPGAKAQAVDFLGLTHPTGVNARSGPGRSFPQTRRYQGDCSIGFNGYCLGEPVLDIFTNPRVPDQRWLALPGGEEYVAAGVVLAQRPWSDLGPRTDCPAVAPTPTRVQLRLPTFVPVGGAVTMRASAPGAATVGFAAYAPNAPETKHAYLRLGLKYLPLDWFGVRDTFVHSWQIFETQTPQRNLGNGLIVAVVCYAAEVPASVADGWTYRWAPRGVALREPGADAAGVFAELDEEVQDRIRQTACLLPEVDD